MPLAVTAAAIAARRRYTASQEQESLAIRALGELTPPAASSSLREGERGGGEETLDYSVVPVRIGRKRVVAHWLRVWAPVYVYVCVLLLAAWGNDLSTAVGRAELQQRHGGLDAAELLFSSSGGDAGVEAAAPIATTAATAASATTETATSRRHGSILYDAGAAWLSDLHHLEWLPDLGVAAMLLLVAAFLSAPVPVPTTTGTTMAQQPNPRWTRFTVLLWSHASVLALRCATSCATVYDASPRCRRHRLLQSANAGFLLNSGCFDLMFSGHASFSFLVGMFACLCPRWSKFAKFLALVAATTSAAANIAVGDHHTSDVLIGAYVGASMAALQAKKWADTF